MGSQAVIKAVAAQGPVHGEQPTLRSRAKTGTETGRSLIIVRSLLLSLPPKIAEIILIVAKR